MIQKTINSLKNDGFKATIKKISLDLKYKRKALLRNFIFIFYKLKAKNGKYLKQVQGSLMNLDIRDIGISKELILTGIHEKNSTAHFKKTIKEGMHIGEFGANIGYYALIASNIVGENGLIYAFEPSFENYKQLKNNITLNNKQNIFKLINKGIGAKNQTMQFYVSSKGNMSSFIKREEYGDIKNIDTLNIDVIKADDFFVNNQLDFVRMDVEGFELEIIEGMHDILSRENKPKGLFIEVHSELLHKRNTSASNFINKLCNYGYEIDIAFFRGLSEISVSSKTELLNHHILEKGYWETFFKKI